MHKVNLGAAAEQHFEEKTEIVHKTTKQQTEDRTQKNTPEAS